MGNGWYFMGLHRVEWCIIGGSTLLSVILVELLGTGVL